MADHNQNPTDELLAHQAQHDSKAFAELYRRHLDRVYRYLYSRVGHVQDAQDLTAQTFVAALEDIGSYNSHDAPFAACVDNPYSTECWKFRQANGFDSNGESYLFWCLRCGWEFNKANVCGSWLINWRVIRS